MYCPEDQHFLNFFPFRFYLNEILVIGDTTIVLYIFMKKQIFGTILSRSPFIFSILFNDLIAYKKELESWVEEKAPDQKNIYALVTLWWHYETPERMAPVPEQLRQFRETAPRITPIFFCNSELERKNFEAIGERAVFCNQNAFLLENRFGVTKTKRIYDAVYLARITPFKRYELAKDVLRLLAIGNYSEKESEYAHKTLAMLSADKVWIPKIYGIFVYKHLNKAKVGLALSAEEGAMYAATEYGLCGLPVLSTRNRGGREYSLCPDYIRILQTDTPTAKDVAEGVEYLIEQKFNPYDIRQATIAIQKRHREYYKNLITQLFDEAHQGSKKNFQMAMNFPHKLGLRTCKPWERFFQNRCIKL